MDVTMRMVYQTEGQHGADIRGWHGEQARQHAEYEDQERWQQHLKESEHD